MAERTAESSPTRRTALKVLGGAAASGGAALAVTGAATRSAASSGRIPEDLGPGGALDRFVADLASKDAFSGTLLVTHRKRTALSRSYGTANKKTGVRNGPETRFGLASVTKMFTATAIHRLARQGDLHYNDRLGDHLDGFPAKIADTVTIHHLLTHTSGLGDYHNLPGYREESQRWDSAEEVLGGTVEFIRKTDPAFPPGAGYEYSNSGFCLLGAIVEAVSGTSYYDYVNEHVFKAAGMRRSGFYTKPQWRTDPTIAHPYHKRPGSPAWVDGLEQHAYIGLPPGGAFATCSDMDRFAHALMDGTLLGAPYTEIMLGPKLPRVPEERSEQPSSSAVDFGAYGSSASLERGRWVHGHTGGSTGGASTSLAFFRDGGWVAVVLSNYADRAAKPVADLARDLILKQ